jgi:acyl-CoA dehydrogenase
LPNWAGRSHNGNADATIADTDRLRLPRTGAEPQETRMDFDYSPRTRDLQARLTAFMDRHIYPAEAAYWAEIEANTRAGKRWTPLQVIEQLKPKARDEGLWNLFLPDSADGLSHTSGNYGAGLSNQEYAPLAEIMGRVPWASEVFNCSAPDTGNMETIVRYGSAEHKKRWLEPLLRGEIRSAFVMTEPDVASSDATNIESRIERQGDDYVINGRKWWISGAGDPRCSVYIFMGKTDPEAPRHSQQSMILIPSDAPGVEVLRPLSVFGYDDAPHGHCEITFTNVRVPASNLMLGEGRGFEIAQGRLGPGRIHHCMRLIGLAERSLELMCRRTSARVAFGRPVADQGVTRERIAEARCRIDMARLLTLKAAWMMDVAGNKAAKSEIAMIKVVAPNLACQVIDWAIQAHGAAGMCEDFPLAYFYTVARTLRFADGPDEVHRNAIAKLELGKYAAA